MVALKTIIKQFDFVNPKMFPRNSWIKKNSQWLPMKSNIFQSLGLESTFVITIEGIFWVHSNIWAESSSRGVLMAFNMIVGEATRGIETMEWNGFHLVQVELSLWFLLSVFFFLHSSHLNWFSLFYILISFCNICFWFFFTVGGIVRAFIGGRITDLIGQRGVRFITF